MFALATDASPGRPNEDFVVATPDLAIVIDGAGIPFHGCNHGVVWYARKLGAYTLAALAGSHDIPLTEGLATAITQVRYLHADTCDLSDPGTPCAAVGILRIGPHSIDALALSDVTVVVELTTGPQVTCDLAIEEINGAEPAAVAGLTLGADEHAVALADLVSRQTATRNRDGGWWVAAADPIAAQHAHTASYPRSELRRACILSDGATRPVDQMHLYDWPEYLDLLDKLGPAGLISHVRAIESSDPVGAAYPRTKRHDDASVAQYTADA